MLGSELDTGLKVGPDTAVPQGFGLGKADGQTDSDAALTVVAMGMAGSVSRAR